MLHNEASVQGIRCWLTDISVENEEKKQQQKHNKNIASKDKTTTSCSPDNGNAFQIDKGCKFHLVYMS